MLKVQGHTAAELLTILSARQLSDVDRSVMDRVGCPVLLV